MAFLPDASTLAAYTLACAVLFVTPGPDMSFFLAKTLSGGRRTGFVAFFGAAAGCLLHTLAAAIGLSALLAASTIGFTILKIVGAAYLLWLAFDAIRSGSALSVNVEDRPVEPWHKTFLLGVGINLTNPKIVLFFVTFLPQFIDAGDPNAAAKLFFLGIYFVALTLPFGLLLVVGAGRLVGYLRTRPSVLRVIDWMFASMFSIFAIRILTTQNR